MKAFEEVIHDVDFCVVGGGLAGMLAAIAAARHGAKVALMHDRPMLGGNASSEIRMWVCGSEGKDLHETGIIEELLLDNIYHNPDKNPSLWDAVMYGAVRYEKNITLLLNCSCNDAVMDGGKIVSVKGWQTTTQKTHIVTAKYFADCSGDSVLAPITGADFKVGREARAEFGESLAPEAADNHTMGMSCLIQARETTSPQPYAPPTWAHNYTDPEMLKPNVRVFNPGSNYWWLELGGMQNSIADTEEIRDELLRVAFGVWDFYKNKGDYGAENWALDWVGFLPGKRESRRYLGDYLMTQQDAEDSAIPHDTVAYGGWSLDDHNPNGFAGDTPSNIFINIKKPPYGIPYRSLYSRNISNLFFAGRNISVTHAALSSTRVMCTCAIIGQAVGTAAAIALKHNTSPRGVYESHLAELQRTLIDDDCYLPSFKNEISPLAAKARLTSNTGDASVLLNGAERPCGDIANSLTLPLGGHVEYNIDAPEEVKEIRIVFDSDLNRNGSHKYNIRSNYAINYVKQDMPSTLAKEFKVEIKDESGDWQELCSNTENMRRLGKLPVGAITTAVRRTPTKVWGDAPTCNIFAFEIR